MRRVQLAQHFRNDSAQFISGARAGRDGGVFTPYFIPVSAIKFWIEKVIAQIRPGLPKDLDLLAREIDIHLSRNRELSYLPVLERNDVDTSLLEVIDLLAVGRELRAALKAGRRGQLLRHERVL